VIVGVPRERKLDEYRVGLTPGNVEQLAERGHKVLVEAGAGEGAGFPDEAYVASGASISGSGEELYAQADMIVKVKEPQPEEIGWIRPGQVVFAYFHFAADLELTRGMLATGAVAIAYETVRDARGRLPLLAPMSEVAGRLSVQEGAKYLEGPMGGRGVLLSGVPGVEPAEVVILGGGVVGMNAARIAAGLGARVTLLDVNLDRLRYLDEIMPVNVRTVYSDPETIRGLLPRADLVIGAVLLPGARAPRLVQRDHLRAMKPRAVVVDVCVDQGGCFETTRPTTHSSPTYVVDGVLHYCVANMPGGVGRTSTLALTHATWPYVLQLAERGYRAAAAEDPGLAEGISIQEGRLTCPAVAATFGMACEPRRLDERGV